MGATIKIPTPSLISYMLYLLIGFTRDLPCPGALEVTEEGLVNLETLVMLDMAITTITTTNTVTTLKMDTIIAIEVNFEDLYVVDPKLSNKMFLSSFFDYQHKYPLTETAFFQM